MLVAGDLGGKARASAQCGLGQTLVAPLVKVSVADFVEAVNAVHCVK